MRQFFNGWRRKVGVALLVLAIAFAGMWMRSFAFYESVYRYGSTTIHEVSSEEGCLIWNCDRRSPKSSHRLSGVLYDWDSMDTSDMTRAAPIRLPDPLNFHEPEWEWKSGGFHFGAGPRPEAAVEYCLARAQSRNDPNEVPRFATTTHLLRDYFDRRTTWMIPFWSIVLLLSVCSASLIFVKPKGRSSRQDVSEKPNEATSP